jgi:catechol 2,3-dioxygenase-like lactoylglutathione lyase family enzyme
VIYGFHHVALSTPNLDACLDFYCNVLGAERTGRESNWTIGSRHSDVSLQVRDTSARYAHVKVGKAYLEIFEFKTPTPIRNDRRAIDIGIAHLCFQVEDLDSEFKRLKRLGMEFHSEPVDFGDGSRYVYGRDVDGNIIELVEIPAGSSTPSNYPIG